MSEKAGLFDFLGGFRLCGRFLFLRLHEVGVGFPLGTLHSGLTSLYLFFLGQFDDMIDANIALQGFADVDVLLVEIVNRHTEDLIIVKARNSDCLTQFRM